jgi:hypothetical protein
MLEAAKGTKRISDKGNAIASGYVRTIKVDEVTWNKSCYTTEAAKGLIADVYELVFKKDAKIQIGSKVRLGNVNSGHDFAFGNDNEYMSRVAMVRGLKLWRESQFIDITPDNYQNAPVQSGDVLYFYFETIDTVFGDQMAELIYEGDAGDVSLRMMIDKSQTVTRNGISYCNRFDIRDYGLNMDFVSNPSMRFNDGTDPKIKLESTHHSEEQGMKLPQKYTDWTVEHIQWAKENDKDRYTAYLEWKAEQAAEKEQELEAQVQRNEREKLESQMKAKIAESIDGCEEIKDQQPYILQAAKRNLESRIPHLSDLAACEAAITAELTELKKFAKEDRRVNLENRRQAAQGAHIQVPNRHQQEMGFRREILYGTDFAAEGQRPSLTETLIAMAVQSSPKMSEAAGRLAVEHFKKSIAPSDWYHQVMANYGAPASAFEGMNVRRLVSESVMKEFNGGGRYDERLVIESIKSLALEAGENTTSDFPTMVRQILPTLVALVRMRSVASMVAPPRAIDRNLYWKRFVEYQRYEMHIFGEVAYDDNSLDTANDDGALASTQAPDLMYIEVTTKLVASSGTGVMTLTLTVIDQNGDEQTVTADITPSHNVGDRIPVQVATSANIGDMYRDCTAATVSISGALSAGKVKIGVEGVISDSETTSTYKRAKVKFKEEAGSTEEIAVATEYTRRLLEIMARSGQTIEQQYAYLANEIQFLTADLYKERDKKFFYNLNLDTNFTLNNRFANDDIPFAMIDPATNDSAWSESMSKRQLAIDSIMEIEDAIRYSTQLGADLGALGGMVGIVSEFNTRYVNWMRRGFNPADFTTNPYERAAMIGTTANGTPYYQAFNQPNRLITVAGRAGIDHAEFIPIWFDDRVLGEKNFLLAVGCDTGVLFSWKESRAKRKFSLTE